MASWKEKATFFAMQDARACRKEYILPFPRVMMPWVQSRLTDDRDLPVACAVFNILVTVPAAATLLFFSQHSAIRGILYFALVQGIFLQRYLVAVLHTTEHRRLFKPGAPRGLCTNFPCMLKLDCWTLVKYDVNADADCRFGFTKCTAQVSAGAFFRIAPGLGVLSPPCYDAPHRKFLAS